MIDVYIAAQLPQLIIIVVTIAVLYVLVLTTILLDLIAGCRKARQRGEYRSSFGLRKTVDKVGRYFNMLLAVTVTDMIQMLAISLLNSQTNMVLPIIPVLTFVGALFACFIEVKSIYEKNDAKEKAKVQETAKIMSEILKNKDNQAMLGAIIEYVKRENPSAKQEAENETT